MVAHPSTLTVSVLFIVTVTPVVTNFGLGGLRMTVVRDSIVLASKVWRSMAHPFAQNVLRVGRLHRLTAATRFDCVYSDRSWYKTWGVRCSVFFTNHIQSPPHWHSSTSNLTHSHSNPWSYGEAHTSATRNAPFTGEQVPIPIGQDVDRTCMGRVDRSREITLVCFIARAGFLGN